MPQAAKAAIAIIAIHAFLTISPPIGLGLVILLVAPALICALDPGCIAEWWEYDKIIRHYGSKAWEGHGTCLSICSSTRPTRFGRYPA